MDYKITQKYGKLINGQLIYAPIELEINERMYCPPSNEQYILMGYKSIIINPQNNTNCYTISRNIIETDINIIIDWELTPMSNDNIKKTRVFQYQTRTDVIYLQYQMELTRGNTEEANALLDKWNNECDLIKQEYPYFNN